MTRFVAVLIMVVALAACASSTTDEAVSKLEPGMSKQKVLGLLGQPADRSFRGVDEALQYQHIAGFGQCKYTTIWLSEGKLVGVTTRRGGSVAGCGLGSQPVDWQQMPSPQPK
jgi:hypothetical protein